MKLLSIQGDFFFFSTEFLHRQELGIKQVIDYLFKIQFDQFTVGDKIFYYFDQFIVGCIFFSLCD